MGSDSKNQAESEGQIVESVTSIDGITRANPKHPDDNQDSYALIYLENGSTLAYVGDGVSSINGTENAANRLRNTIRETEWSKIVDKDDAITRIFEGVHITSKANVDKSAAAVVTLREGEDLTLAWLGDPSVLLLSVDNKGKVGYEELVLHDNRYLAVMANAFAESLEVEPNHPEIAKTLRQFQSDSNTTKILSRWKSKKASEQDYTVIIDGKKAKLKLDHNEFLDNSNMITRAIGKRNDPDEKGTPNISHLKLPKPFVLITASDGLTDNLPYDLLETSIEEVKEEMRNGKINNLEEFTERLTNLLKERAYEIMNTPNGKKDDITFMVEVSEEFFKMIGESKGFGSGIDGLSNVVPTVGSLIGAIRDKALRRLPQEAGVALIEDIIKESSSIPELIQELSNKRLHGVQLGNADIRRQVATLKSYIAEARDYVLNNDSTDSLPRNDIIPTRELGLRSKAISLVIKECLELEDFNGAQFRNLLTFLNFKSTPDEIINRIKSSGNDFSWLPIDLRPLAEKLRIERKL